MFSEERFQNISPQIFKNITFYSKRLNIAIMGRMEFEGYYNSLDILDLNNVNEIKEIRGGESLIKDIN